MEESRKLLMGRFYMQKTLGMEGSVAHVNVSKLYLNYVIKDSNSSSSQKSAELTVFGSLAYIKLFAC